MKCKVHKYKRVRAKDSGKYDTYTCIRCPHYVTEPFVIGRDAECWICGNTFTMNIKSLLLKPHCGCKSEAPRLEKVSQGAAIDNNKISEIRAPKVKKEDPLLAEAKSNVLDSLLSKFGS